MTWREMQAQFRHPLFVGMVLSLVFCIVLIGPYDPLLHFGALRLAIFYAACFCGFSAALCLALYLCHRWDWRAFSVLTVGFAGLASTAIGLWAALLLGAPVPSVSDMLLVTGFNLVFCYLGDMLLSTFIIPRIIADLRGRSSKDVLAEFIGSEAGSIHIGPAAAPTAPCQPEVTIFGKPFATHTIWLIEAEEHYVAITQKDGSRHLLRGRIADAVAALPATIGRRVHRSYWVATAAVTGFRTDKAGAHLVLTDGRTIPVARQRMAETRAWAQGIKGCADMKKAPQRVPVPMA